MYIKPECKFFNNNVLFFYLSILNICNWIIWLFSYNKVNSNFKTLEEDTENYFLLSEGGFFFTTFPQI